MSKCETGSRGTAYIKKKTQIAYNQEEQGENKNYLLRGKGEQDGNPSHPPPHPPVATLEPEPANFQKNPRICGKTGKFEAYSQVTCLGGGVPWRIFPKSADFLPLILKLFKSKPVM